MDAGVVELSSLVVPYRRHQVEPYVCPTPTVQWFILGLKEERGIDITTPF